MSYFARQLFIGACAGLFLCSSLSLAHAQPGAARPTTAAPDKRERVKQKVRAMRAYVLTEALALDPSTAGKMFPVMEKFDNESDALTVARAGLRTKLEISTDGKTLNKVIDDLLANQKAMFDMEAKRLVELRAILTPQQVAKLITVLPDFERRLQNRLGKGNGARGGNPFDDGDANADPRGGNPGRPGGRGRQPGGDGSQFGPNPFGNRGRGSAAGQATPAPRSVP
ncbi:MAG: hypothetical protein KBG15_20205 [Kofleriaceae bacterium]|nr:hypothetical protein [Kofleriaceae bacterium]